MASTFICCKNKPQKSYLCVVCNNLMHKSCSERRNITVINKNLIWCSEKCAENAVKPEDSVTDSMRHYEVTIQNLEKEIQEKDRYIQRLKTLNKDLEQEMLEYDHKSEKIILEQSREIVELKNEMKQSLEESLNIHKNILKTTVDMGTQTIFLAQTNMKTHSIECQTMTERINSCKQTEKPPHTPNGDTQTELSEEQIEEARLLNALIKINITKSTQTPIWPDQYKEEKLLKPTPIRSKQKLDTGKPQLLLLTNAKLRGFGRIFKEYTNNGFDINMQYIHKGTFDDLIARSQNYIHKMKSQDAILLFVGPENAIKDKGIKSIQLQNLYKNGKPANVLVAACPFSKNRTILNKFIKKNNLELKRATENTNITYIETSQIIKAQKITTSICWGHQCLNNLIKHVCEKLCTTEGTKKFQGTPIKASLNQNEEFELRLQKIRQSASDKQTPLGQVRCINIIENIQVKSPLETTQNKPGTQQTQTISPVAKKNCFFCYPRHNDTGWQPMGCSTQKFQFTTSNKPIDSFPSKYAMSGK